jgi:hypothetical protein
MKRLFHSSLLVASCTLALAGCDFGDPYHMTLTLSDDKPPAGGQLVATVAVVDASGRDVVGYVGRVQFDGDDTGAQLPADYRFGPADRGRHGFIVKVKNAGKHTLRVHDAKVAALQASAFYNVQSRPLHLTVVAGDMQTATVGQPLPQPLVVKLTDVGGNAVPGTIIAWSVVGGGGNFAATATATAMDGTAATTFTLGHKAGPVMLAATVQEGGDAAAALTARGTAGALATLTKAAGDQQTAVAGTTLPLPLAVAAADAWGNPVAGVTVQWRAVDGGGAVGAASTTSADDGTSSTSATLGPSAATSTFAASAAGAPPVTFTATRLPFKLAYRDPPDGKLRLVRNLASTDATVVLDLVVGAQPVTGYSAGFNLPVDVSRVALDATAPLTPGTALSPGSSPIAAKAILPSSGPLSGVLVSAQSQKATGAGAVPRDTTLPSGTLLYSLKLNLVPTGAPGVVFDGTKPWFTLPSGGLRDKNGTQVVNAAEVAIGALEVTR